MATVYTPRQQLEAVIGLMGVVAVFAPELPRAARAAGGVLAAVVLYRLWPRPGGNIQVILPSETSFGPSITSGADALGNDIDNLFLSP